MITINTIQTGTSKGAVPPVKVLHEEMVTIPINGKERVIDTILRNDLPWQSSSLWRKKITCLVDNGCLIICLILWGVKRYQKRARMKRVILWFFFLTYNNWNTSCIIDWAASIRVVCRGTTEWMTHSTQLTTYILDTLQSTFVYRTIHSTIVSTEQCTQNCTWVLDICLVHLYTYTQYCAPVDASG